MVEAVENSLQSSENSLQCNENSLQITENEELHVAAEKKRGRPKGSTDKTPRKRTVIREEPVTPVKVEPVPAVTDVPPAPTVVAIAAIAKKKRRTNLGTEPILPESESVTMDRMRLVQNIISERPPLSPRTLLRQAGETFYALQNQRDTARREFWAQQVAKSVR